MARSGRDASGNFDEVASGSGYAGAQSLQAAQSVGIDLHGMVHVPAEPGDGRGGVHLFPHAGDGALIFGAVGVLVVAPAALGDQANRVFINGRRIPQIAGGDPFADAGDAHAIVAEIEELVIEALGEERQVGLQIARVEKKPEASVELAFAMQRQEMIVAGEGVQRAGVGGDLQQPAPDGSGAELRPGRVVEGRSAAGLIVVRGDAEAQGVARDFERGAPQIIGSFEGADGVQGGKAGIGRAAGAGNGAVGGNGDALGFEEGFAGSVRHAGAVEAGKQQDGIVRRGGIQFGQSGQALLGKLHRIPSADGGDPGAGLGGFRAAANGVLNLGDGGGGIEARVEAGPLAEGDKMFVAIDEAGNRGVAAQIDKLWRKRRAWECRGPCRRRRSGRRE